MSAEYSIYKKDELLFTGTAKECAEHFNVRVKTIWDWASPCNIKYADTGIKAGRKPRIKERSGVKVAVRVN